MRQITPNPMNLKQFRTHLGLTQQEFADAIDVKQAHVSKLETTWPRVRLVTMQAIAKTFGVAVVVTGEGVEIREG